MKLLGQFDKLNKTYSYNIFALNGLNILLSRIYLYLYYNYHLNHYGGGSWMATIGWIKFIHDCFIFIIFIIALIVWLFEIAFTFTFKIDNEFILNNKLIKITRLFLGAISLYYIAINAFNFTITIFTMFL